MQKSAQMHTMVYKCPSIALTLARNASALPSTMSSALSLPLCLLLFAGECEELLSWLDDFDRRRRLCLDLCFPSLDFLLREECLLRRLRLRSLLLLDEALLSLLELLLRLRARLRLWLSFLDLPSICSLSLSSEEVAVLGLAPE